jgi:very-short-patch-repair endonuclease
MARTQRRLVGHARAMRREPTDAEKRLWFALKDRRLATYKFRRQHAIDRYIVDFACLEAQLIIELDGGQHAGQVRYDDKRTQRLQALGFRVLRFWNNDALSNAEGVLTMILAALAGDEAPS